MAALDAGRGEPLAPDLDDRVRSELQAGETLVWTGQPRARWMVLRALPIVIFAIPWTGFAVFWMVMAGSMFASGPRPQPEPFSWASRLFPLFGLPFVLIGIGMLLSPLLAVRRARLTCYALTDRRAIVSTPGWFGGLTVRSYGPGDLGAMHRNERAGGSGDLVFEEVVHRGTRDSPVHRWGFFAIDGVREVEDLVRKTLLPGR